MSASSTLQRSAPGELPWRGLGLSSNASEADQPHPYRLFRRAGAVRFRRVQRPARPRAGSARGIALANDESVGALFGAFARRLAREQRDDALTQALAFEIWAQSAAPRHPAAAVPGQLALASGVALAAFPVDLRELLFAARSLRRHLTARAWASGVLESSALEGLAQVARRPLPGPWEVALRRVGERVEVIEPDPALREVLVRAGLSAKASGVDSGALLRAVRLGLVRQ